MSSPVKTGLHHWWPKGLSSFWVGDDDCVTRVAPDGSELRSPPAQFGGITNGHTVRLGGPWSFSFESKFDGIDSRLPYLVEDLLKYEAKPSLVGQPIEGRLQAHSPIDGFMEEVGSTLASLIVRSPSYRNNIAKTAEYYRDRFGLPQPKADKNLINLNLSHKFELFSKNFRDGKFIFAFSDEAEFIFGDGFYTNMATEFLHGHAKTITPITPVLSIIYSRPTSYYTLPKIVTIRLQKNEVNQFNELVQIYSKEQIFYRSHRPSLSAAFQRGEFLKFQYHKVPWLDGFLESVHRYRG